VSREASNSSYQPPPSHDPVPAVYNWKLLLVAAIMGLVVVVIYNLRINQVRKEERGQTIELLCYKHDMAAGDMLTEKDIETRLVETHYKNSFDDVVPSANRNSIVGFEGKGRTLLTTVKQAGWVRYSHIMDVDETEKPSDRIGSKKRAVTLEVERRSVPGEVLRVGDRIDIMTMLSVGAKPRQAYRVVESVRVLAIGGKTINLKPSSKVQPGDEALRGYESVTVEMAPDESRKLYNVLSHKIGSVWIEVRNPHDEVPQTAGQVSPELKDLAETAAAPTTGSPTGGGH
jgi:Flp pilus assembly protein CpaB